MSSSIGGLVTSGELDSRGDVGGEEGPAKVVLKGVTEGLTAPVVSTIFVVVSQGRGEENTAAES